ncbi:hypothetical protein EOM60_01505 [Candidatus Saccharibacteria bacterium]|nr:hypothetical protein [Candidatus Saccharibacteria bacterium]
MRKLASFRQAKLSLVETMWLGLPVVVWFSYWPNIHFGRSDTMNFEISVVLIYCLVLALVGLPSVWRNRRELVKNRQIWLVSLLVIYAGATVLWSLNATRGFLTAGIIGVLYLIFLGFVARRQQLVKLAPRLIRLTVGSAVVMSGLAIVQFLIGIWLSGEATLLCAGCVSGQFGWPRPNVFAIEPQFFGSLLLPSLLIVSRQVLVKPVNRRIALTLLLLQIVLLLTMSRGAIYAYLLGVLIIMVMNYRQVKRIGQLMVVSLLALVISLSGQGLAAISSPSISESFGGAVAKSINQLSLGVIDLGQKSVPEPASSSGKEAPAFDGYVEESTDIRLGRTEMALGAWRKDLSTMLFGVGLGGAGTAISQAYPDQIGAREIIQNEYVERLLERGLIGLMLFVVALVWLIRRARSRWLMAIIVAFVFQWLFFSGYPNAFHIYLFMIAVWVLALPAPRVNTSVVDS